jgi:F-box/leucine-rich repeat protein 14
MPTLEWLSLDKTPVTTVVHLASCKALKVLSLGWCRGLTDDGIAGLEQIPTLEMLDLQVTRITAVAHLSACRVLKRLNLGWCRKIRNPGIVGLEQIPTLEELSLEGVGLTSVRNLSHCTALRILHIAGCDIPDTEIEALRLIPTLEHLDLYGSPEYVMGEIDEDLMIFEYWENEIPGPH